MDKQQAFAAINQIRTDFLAKVAHPDGATITRAMLRNVDAEAVTEACIVFRNADNQFLVVPFTANLSHYSQLKVTEDKRKKFPSLVDIEREYIEPIAAVFIRNSTVFTNDDKSAILDYLSDWVITSPANPENKQKIEQYETLKKELEDKGLL